MSKRTVQRALNDLLKAGMIKKNQGTEKMVDSQVIFIPFV